ncbi:hypothetical protein Desaci_3324 [Desulfosporosinus acidiphilus SJ4]|uniref:Uncharacterized protein n=1 Tax=Desulfosporosinus acidiphilus (strain DSM 22704 / JCM 16185 / SJ4) TaxID=646529 RepID=I4D8U6_DESAJ|nr:hypothetical protein Desaci_3324 [Desulfosporosinus acidiphilus SJ4]
MDIKEIDFNSRDEANNCLKELLSEDAFNYQL